MCQSAVQVNCRKGVARQASSHARKTEIDAVGEHGSHQSSRIVRRRAGTQMRETVGEPCPGMDLRKKLGDAQTRQHRVEAANDRVGLLVLRLANRTDRQAFLGE